MIFLFPFCLLASSSLDWASRVHSPVITPDYSSPPREALPRSVVLGGALGDNCLRRYQLPSGFKIKHAAA